MLEPLLSGLRSIRVSFITGAAILFSLYVLSHEVLASKFLIRPFVKELLSFSKMLPLILLAIASLIVGSLYTTFLEGIVDGLHKKRIHLKSIKSNNPLKKTLLSSLLPYSVSAKKRLAKEAERFFNEHISKCDKLMLPKQQDFVNDVFVEALWMEGKIAGSNLEQPYDRMRSEGEIRLGGGLLIPLLSLAISHTLYCKWYTMIIIFALSLVLSYLMVNYGLYYYKKANSFLAHHIADGKVLSPSMETLKRNSGGGDESKSEVKITDEISIYIKK